MLKKKKRTKIMSRIREELLQESAETQRPSPSDTLHTCVIKEGGDEGAVLEEGVAGGDIFKVTLLKQRILKHHRPHLQVHESASEKQK